MRVARSLPPFVAAASLALLAGCQDKPAVPSAATEPTSAVAPAPSRPTFTDASLGLSLKVPQGMSLHRDFKRSYLDAGAWKIDAPAGSRGTPEAALVLDGSNAVTSAELRIGSSDDAEAVKHCQDTPPGAPPGSSNEATLSGIRFRHFKAGDAAMSHYRDVDGYRAVHDGRCLAIDLLVSGTRPEVYDPPKPQPFTHAEAWSKLHAALDGLTIDR